MEIVLTFSAYIFQSTRSLGGNFCACISYQPNRGVTHAFIHGLDEAEIESFISRLRQLPTLVAIPTFIPAILIEERESMCRKSLSNSSALISEIEQQTGFGTRWWATRASWAPWSTTNIEELDFSELTQDITSASTKLAYVQYRCNSYLPILNSLDRINKRYRNTKWPNKQEIGEAQIQLRGLVGRVRASMECTLARCAYQIARADIQRQTVSQYKRFREVSKIHDISRCIAWSHRRTAFSARL